MHTLHHLEIAYTFTLSWVHTISIDLQILITVVIVFALFDCFTEASCAIMTCIGGSVTIGNGEILDNTARRNIAWARLVT